MNLTGHPFIDVGMAIAAKLSDVPSLDDLTENDLANAVSQFDLYTDEIKKLSILGRFWLNNSYVNNPSQFPKYQGIVRSASSHSTPQRNGFCQICGDNHVFINADRCWLPLGGSFKGDAVTYANMGGRLLCVNCFRALIALTMGCQMCGGGMYIFHLLDSELQVQAVAKGVNAIQMAIASNASGNAVLKPNPPIKLSGRLELLEIAARSHLWGTEKQGILSRNSATGATIISFNNDKKPAYSELKLPAQALDFFGEIMRAEGNLTELFIRWAENWAKYVKDTKSGAYDRICDDVEARSSLAPILGAMIKARKIPTFTGEEKQLLKIYEDVALEKRKRFDALERIAERIKGMEPRYRESLIKQLANIRTKSALVELLKDAAHHREKTKFSVLTKEEIRLVSETTASESINLLYLLCVADA